MDLLDLYWWNQLDKTNYELQTHAKTAGRTAARLKDLQDENHELRIRVSLLIRLLIERGVFTADDFTKLLAETKERLVTPPPPKRRK